MKITYIVFEIGGDDVFNAIYEKICEEEYDKQYIKNILTSISLNTTIVEVEDNKCYRKLFKEFSWASYFTYLKVDGRILVLFTDNELQEPSVVSTSEIVKKMIEDYNNEKERSEKNRAKKVRQEKKRLDAAEQCVSDIINN